MLLFGTQVYKENINISVACCHPGYEYKSENGTSEGGTCSFNKDVFPHVLRPESSNRYVYISVSITWTTSLISIYITFQMCMQNGEDLYIFHDNCMHAHSLATLQDSKIILITMVVSSPSPTCQSPSSTVTRRGTGQAVSTSMTMLMPSARTTGKVCQIERCCIL